MNADLKLTNLGGNVSHIRRVRKGNLMLELNKFSEKSVDKKWKLKLPRENAALNEQFILTHIEQSIIKRMKACGNING